MILDERSQRGWRHQRWWLLHVIPAVGRQVEFTGQPSCFVNSRSVRVRVSKIR